MSDAPTHLDDCVRLDSICNIVQGGRHKLSGKHFIEDGGYPAYGAGGHNGNLPSYEFDRPGISSIRDRCQVWQVLPADRTLVELGQTLLFSFRTKSELISVFFGISSMTNCPGTDQGRPNPTSKPSDIKGRKVYVPPLAEQKRIAEILDAADDLRAKRRESLAQLDALLQSTFLDIFGDPNTNSMELEEVQVP